MARPVSNVDSYLHQPEGVGDQNGRSPIPNGQPPQFNRPPIYPEKMARPIMGHHMLQNMAPATSNGIQQQYSHPSSLSSHSSRDVSPVPHHRPPYSNPSSHQPSPSATPPPVQPTNQPPAASQHWQAPPNRVNNYPAGPNRQQLPPNFSPGQNYHPADLSRQPVEPSRQMQSSSPSSQLFRPTVGQQASNQSPNIPASSFAPNQSTPNVSQPSAMNFPPLASKTAPVISQPNYAPVQTNPAPSFAPVQTNTATSFTPVQTNTAPSYVPVQSNPAPSFVPVQSNPAPSFVPGQAHPTPSFAPAQTNLPPRQTNSRFPPNSQTNPIQSFGPTQPNFSQNPSQASSVASFPPPSATNPMTRTDALGSLPSSQSHPNVLQTISTPSRMGSYGSPHKQPMASQQTAPGLNGPSYQSMPTFGSSSRPPGQNGPPMAPQPGMGPPHQGMGPQQGLTAQQGMGQPHQGMPPSQQGMAPPQGIRPPQQGMAPTQQGMAPPQPGIPPSQQGMVPPQGIRPPQPGMPQTQQGMAPTQQGMAPPQPGMAPPQPGIPPSQQGMGPPQGIRPPQPGMAQVQQGMAPTQPGMAPQQQGMTPHLFGQPTTGLNGQQLPPYGQPPTKENSSLPKRYPQAPSQAGYSSGMAPRPGSDANFNQQLAGLSVAQQGFSKLWGAEQYDLLQTRNILPAEKVEVPRVKLQQEFLDAVNCSPEIFRCTLTKIPETSALLQKSRLPLGVLIHPFKDLNHLAVIQCQSIVRCRACRTYINPFVYFVDHKRWKCNLCFRVNELPEEFQFDPVSKTYGDPSRRPEIKSATIEFIAPSEYMLRPPQPAVYLFLLDVSCLASECGYLALACAVLLEELDRLPGDGRTQVGFITYDTTLRFYSLAEGLNQPQEMTVMDVDDVFLPSPDTLIVNLNECKELVKDLLRELPKRFAQSHDSNSCLGAALQAAFKLMSSTGGRVTVFQACLPNFGPGALAAREDPSARAGKDVQHLNPATDFYKRLALDCSGQQVAVDLFVVNQQYCDLATLSGVSRFSGGSIHHFPLFKAADPLKSDALEQSFRRYLTRKLGLEAVMRIRCSRGLSIHTFHGNFFVRSTDLLSLPNVNPDAGFAMQVAVEESLADLQNVCFQAALLYTSSKGERRIRVHTLCLPVASNLSDILHSADQQCIVGLLAKMAVDRSVQSSLGDAREAFINVAVDVLSAYKMAQPGSSALASPHNLRLLPLYILALLKYVGFRTGQSTRLDDRVSAMCQMKTLPLAGLIQEIYPDLYPVHRLMEQATVDVDGTAVPQPPRLHLSAEKLESSGAFLLDAGAHMILFIGRSVGATFCQAVFSVNSFQEIPEHMLELPLIETPESESLRHFIAYLQSDKPWPATLQIIRDDSQDRTKFYERLLEDRTESSLSYYEFLQHLKTNVK